MKYLKYDLPDDHASRCQTARHEPADDSRTTFYPTNPEKGKGALTNKKTVAECKHCGTLYVVKS